MPDRIKAYAAYYEKRWVTPRQLQPVDKIVVRFALTIYPYSLDEAATRQKKN